MSHLQGLKLLFDAHPVIALLPISALLLLAVTASMALQCQRNRPLPLDSVWMKVIWFFGGMPVERGFGAKNLFQRHREMFPKSHLGHLARALQVLAFFSLFLMSVYGQHSTSRPTSVPPIAAQPHR